MKDHAHPVDVYTPGFDLGIFYRWLGRHYEALDVAMAALTNRKADR